METENPKCPIWGIQVESIKCVADRDAFVVLNSPRAAGDYEINAQGKLAVAVLDDVQKARLTTMLIDRRIAGEDTPTVTPKLVEDAKSRAPLPAHARAERLLRHIARISGSVGKLIGIRNILLRDPGALAWSESTNPEELYFFVNYLTEKNWLQEEKTSNGRGSGRFNVTVNGYSKIEEFFSRNDSTQCFVAMWFDEDMTEAYEKGIEKAVAMCGYKALRIDKKPNVNKVDDEIVAEIRRSRFVVADFTHGDDGARGGVYFEAGFAYGLGLRVIYSCRKDMVDKLHFDTRQFYHIVWETPDELCDGLRKRILSLIGEGPNIGTTVP